ncbi:hypothetical protein [Noviherbaspirillum denitrificans]|uniref:hypothetical protein n=1 Tax=Noviherbaspirillum denitrificans TaxID=1968433 RepID=UPI001483CC89|nr:hypothetical protein [Noviherbaspirillum denitrificans]
MTTDPNPEFNAVNIGWRCVSYLRLEQRKFPLVQQRFMAQYVGRMVARADPEVAVITTDPSIENFRYFNARVPQHKGDGLLIPMKAGSRFHV